MLATDFDEQTFDHAERLLKRLDEAKSFLLFAKSVSASTSPTRAAWPSATAEGRAAAIIACAAELESLVKATIQRAHTALNDLQLPVQAFRESLRPLLAHDEFESLRALQDHDKLWDRRLYTTTLGACSETARFPLVLRKAPQPPLDGKTLKPTHLQRLWDLYGLPGTPFPTLAWSTSLLKVAGSRNDIAHGNLAFSEIFRQPGIGVAEVEVYVDHVGSIAVHFCDSWSAWFSYALYLKA